MKKLIPQLPPTKKVFKIDGKVYREGETMIVQTDEFGDWLLPIKPCSYMSGFGSIAYLDLGQIEHEGRKAWVSLTVHEKVSLASRCYLPFAQLRVQFYWPMTHLFDVRLYDVRLEGHRVFHTLKVPEMPKYVYAQKVFNPAQLELF